MSSESHTPEPAPASQEQVREIQKHIIGYWKIFAVQVAFAIAMVLISFGNFGSSAAQVAATLFVAALNGILVAGILMHLKEEKRTIWKFLIFTGVFFFILFFLTYLARTDTILQTLHSHH
jgi:heme/copper-type cytochrome/quinol oxidase subunit 4